MRQGENVRDFHGRFFAAIRGAEAAIKENLSREQVGTSQRPHLEMLALESSRREGATMSEPQYQRSSMKFAPTEMSTLQEQ